MNEQKQQQYLCGLSILSTSLVLFLLGAGCLLISNDAMVLVIQPFEKMLGLIKKLTMSATRSDNTSEGDDTGDNDGESNGDSESGTEDGALYSFESSDDQEAEVIVEMMGRYIFQIICFILLTL